MILRKAAAISLACLCLLGVGLLFQGLDGGEIRLPGARPIPLAAGEDRVAETLLSPLAGKPDPAAATRASVAALSQAPFDNAALLRLAYIDQMRTGALTAAGFDTLRTSYARMPYDRTLGFWRIRFALEHWETLPSDLRQKTQSEVFVLASEPGHRWPMRGQLSRITNPYGAVVASFWRARVAAMM